MGKIPQSAWIVAREYAGVAEAGGVKNVSCSLSESLARRGLSVTAFIPRYGFVDLPSTSLFFGRVSVGGVDHPIGFSRTELNGVSIVLIDSPVFREKRSVYTYTEEEAARAPGSSRGTGYHDGDVMNLVMQRAVCAYARLSDSSPDILHCHDAHAALLPAIAKTDPDFRELFAETACVVTIHNAGPGYRQAISDIPRAQYLSGLSCEVLREGVFNGAVEPFLVAAPYATLTTVSPWYAKELTSSAYDAFTDGLSGEFERRKICVVGITNGIDYHRYDPSNPGISALPFAFEPAAGELTGKYKCRERLYSVLRDFPDDSDVTAFGYIDPIGSRALFAYQGRVVTQKGLIALEYAARVVLDRYPGSRFVVMGQGEPALESLLIRMTSRFAGRFAFARGYERDLARLVVASADFLVLPSVFEPCGLEDFIGQIFGAIPIAHAVGGLQKIEEGKTGFLFRSETGDSGGALAETLSGIMRTVEAAERASIGEIPAFNAIIREASARIRSSWSWDTVTDLHWLPLYREILSKPS